MVKARAAKILSVTLPLFKRKRFTAAALVSTATAFLGPKLTLAAVLAVASAALFGCATVTSTAALPPISSPTATTAPTPSPTPAPKLLLIAEGEVAGEGDLEEWAAQRGWVVTRANPSGAAAYLEESKTHVQAVVSQGEALGGDLQLAAEDGIPVVAIDVPVVTPMPMLSTIGNPRHDQAGFLAGVMTGLASQTGWVGQVTDTGGPDEKAYSAGFTQGLLWGCPKCQLISQTAAEMTLDRFRANTVDAVFILPGPEADEAANALAGGGIPIVWVGEGGSIVEALIGRLVFEEGSLVVLALDELVSTGEGETWRPSIETSTLFPADINDEFLSPGRQRLFEEAYEAIAAGELDIGTDLEG